MPEEIKIIHLKGELEVLVLIFGPGGGELFGGKILKGHGNVGVKDITGQHVAEAELFAQKAHELLVRFHNGRLPFHVDIQDLLLLERVGAEAVEINFERRQGGCKIRELGGECFFQQGVCREGYLQGNMRQHFYSMAGSVFFCKFLFKADDLLSGFRSGQQGDEVDLVFPFRCFGLAGSLFGKGLVTLVKPAAAIIVTGVSAPVVTFPVIGTSPVPVFLVV